MLSYKQICSSFIVCKLFVKNVYIYVNCSYFFIIYEYVSKENYYKQIKKLNEFLFKIINLQLGINIQTLCYISYKHYTLVHFEL